MMQDIPVTGYRQTRVASQASCRLT